MLLSVIIPAWQEARRMGRLVGGARALVGQLPYPVEVLVVDDGSTDGTGAMAEQAGFRVLHEPHRGKGAAVRAGMLAARGQYRLIADADWSMPPDQAMTMIPPALTGFDVAIGSRQVHGARRIGEPALRHYMGRAFNRMVQQLVLSGYEDTQCGFKVFRAEAARAIFSRTVEDGWAFDVEVLVIARALGLRVMEVPIDWTYDGDSRVKPFSDALSMLRAVGRIRARALRDEYHVGAAPQTKDSAEESEQR